MGWNIKLRVLKYQSSRSGLNVCWAPWWWCHRLNNIADMSGYHFSTSGCRCCDVGFLSFAVSVLCQDAAVRDLRRAYYAVISLTDNRLGKVWTTNPCGLDALLCVQFAFKLRCAHGHLTTSWSLGTETFLFLKFLVHTVCHVSAMTEYSDIVSTKENVQRNLCSVVVCVSIETVAHIHLLHGRFEIRRSEC